MIIVDGRTYHLVNPEEEHPHAPGILHLVKNCWCEPHYVDMGKDADGSPLWLLNHHRPEYYCCRAHDIAPAHTGYYPIPLVGTGPFSDDSELEDEVMPVAS